MKCVDETGDKERQEDGAVDARQVRIRGLPRKRKGEDEGQQQRQHGQERIVQGRILFPGQIVIRRTNRNGRVVAFFAGFVAAEEIINTRDDDQNRNDDLHLVTGVCGYLHPQEIRSPVGVRGIQAEV